MKTWITAFGPVAAALALSGCASSNDDLQQWMEAEAKGMRGQVSPLPPVRPFMAIPFIGRTMNDPFGPKKSQKAASNAPDQTRKREFLESFPLDQLTLMGSILRNGQRWGLVRAPDGTIIMVKPGDYMGQNFGKIVAVDFAKVTLRESVLDPQGDWMDREVPFAVSAARASR